MSPRMPPPEPPDGFARSLRVARRASDLGFDWERPEDVLPKVREEVDELEAAIAGRDPREVFHELGDLLFAAVNAARLLDVEPGAALRAASGRFEARFGWIEARLESRGRSVAQTPAEELDRLWNEAKRALS